MDQDLVDKLTVITRKFKIYINKQYQQKSPLESLTVPQDQTHYQPQPSPQSVTIHQTIINPQPVPQIIIRETSPFFTPLVIGRSTPEVVVHDHSTKIYNVVGEKTKSEKKVSFAVSSTDSGNKKKDDKKKDEKKEEEKKKEENNNELAFDLIKTVIVVAPIIAAAIYKISKDECVGLWLSGLETDFKELNILVQLCNNDDEYKQCLLDLIKIYNEWITAHTKRTKSTLWGKILTTCSAAVSVGGFFLMKHLQTPFVLVGGIAGIVGFGGYTWWKYLTDEKSLEKINYEQLGKALEDCLLKLTPKNTGLYPDTNQLSQNPSYISPMPSAPVDGNYSSLYDNQTGKPVLRIDMNSLNVPENIPTSSFDPKQKVD